MEDSWTEQEKKRLSRILSDASTRLKNIVGSDLISGQDLSDLTDSILTINRIKNNLMDGDES